MLESERLSLCVHVGILNSDIQARAIVGIESDSIFTFAQCRLFNSPNSCLVGCQLKHISSTEVQRYTETFGPTMLLQASLTNMNLIFANQ